VVVLVLVVVVEVIVVVLVLVVVVVWSGGSIPGDLETNSCMAIFGPLLILVRLNMPWPHCYQCI